MLPLYNFKIYAGVRGGCIIRTVGETRQDGKLRRLLHAAGAEVRVVVADDELSGVLRAARRPLHGRSVHVTHARARLHRRAIHGHLPSVPQRTLLYGLSGWQGLSHRCPALPRTRLGTGSHLTATNYIL